MEVAEFCLSILFARPASLPQLRSDSRQPGPQQQQRCRFGNGRLIPGNSSGYLRRATSLHEQIGDRQRESAGATRVAEGEVLRRR